MRAPLLVRGGFGFLLAPSDAHYASGACLRRRLPSGQPARGYGKLLQSNLPKFTSLPSPPRLLPALQLPVVLEARLRHDRNRATHRSNPPLRRARWVEKAGGNGAARAASKTHSDAVQPPRGFFLGPFCCPLAQPGRGYGDLGEIAFGCPSKRSLAPPRRVGDTPAWRIRRVESACYGESPAPLPRSAAAVREYI